ncbi:hypothetical protein KSH70_027210, partial [Escherichia coli]|nr:hypothetical protein [Escherichia coli]
PGQRGVVHGGRDTPWVSRGLQNTKMKTPVFFMNFLNYITNGCLFSRLVRDFYFRTDFLFFLGH